MKVEMHVSGLEGVLETLRSLPAEVVSAKGGPVKLALATGARFMRDRAKENLVRSIAESGRNDSTGLLLANVISSRGKPPTGSKGERYLVRVRRKAYDLQKIGKKESRSKTRKRVTTLQTANLLEYGSRHQPARPWLRPVIPQHGAEVINLVTNDLNRRLALVVRKLAQQNRNRG